MNKLVIIIGMLAAVGIFSWGSNNWLTTTEYTVHSTDIPEAFDGTRIVHLSDLHNAMFGEEQSSLISRVEAAEPDVIFLTGDLVDSNRYDLEAALVLVDALVGMSEVYFVTGNHEIAANKVDEVTAALEERGVTVLMDETHVWERDGERIQIAGINDPLLSLDMTPAEFTEKTIGQLALSGEFTLLLAHRPELLQIYAEAGIDLVFSGHAHGGQIRLPGIGGLIAPGQGWLPELTDGVYQQENTRLIVSRGLGNSGFPVRILNRPEVVAVTLERN